MLKLEAEEAPTDVFLHLRDPLPDLHHRFHSAEGVLDLPR